jgi:hypothetical protein
VDGGTRVRLKLTKALDGENAFGYSSRHGPIPLAQLCRELAPALDVDVYVNQNGKREKIIAANDWLDLNGEEFLSRFRNDEVRPYNSRLKSFKARAAQNLRLLKDDKGVVFGRACIGKGYGDFDGNFDELYGAVTVGGLFSNGLAGIVGVLAGSALRASRDSARPKVPDLVLKHWAEEQACLVSRLWKQPKEQAACAKYIRLCGGSTKDLRSQPLAGNGYPLRS